MSAMIEENLMLAKRLAQISHHTAAGRTYTLGKYHGHELVIAFSRWGKIASAITATHLINHFEVDQIIFTGVAGSTSPDLKVGDIVIADKLVQHDMDARPIFKQFEIPLINQSHFESSQKLQQKALKASKLFLENYETYISKEKIAQFKLSNPKVSVGKIASGDKFFSSKDDLKQLKALIPDALCVEMEGASVAQVCFEHDVPFCVIRTISDNGDETSHVDFNQFVKSVASPYSLGILENYFRLENKKARPLLDSKYK